jgi:ATPase subunit of ABC transporter with duplicated ATPase domains
MNETRRIDEASAEVAAAKRIYPAHDKIPKYEKWLQQLRQKRDTVKAAADAKNAETANQQAAIQAETQRRAAEAERARRAEEQRQKEQTQRQQAEATLAGTSWQGEAVIKMDEQLTLPIAFVINNNDVVSGKITFSGEGETKEFDLQGTYDPKSGDFNLKFSRSEEGVNIQGKLTGTAKSSTSVQGTITMKASGFGEGESKGTWRASRK